MEKFKNLTEPLQKLAAGRLILGAVTLVLGVLCHTCLRNWLLSLPGFVVGSFPIFNRFRLFVRLASGGYLCLRGVCLEIEKVKLVKQIKRTVTDIEGKRV